MRSVIGAVLVAGLVLGLAGGLASCASTAPSPVAQEWFDLGNAWLEKGDWKKAGQAYSRALALDPQYAGASYNLARAFTESGDYDRALQTLDALDKRDPGNVKILASRAYALYKRGDAKAALAAYRELLKLDEFSPDAVYNAALLELASGYASNAIDDLQRLTSAKPDDGQAFLLLGRSIDRRAAGAAKSSKAAAGKTVGGAGAAGMAASPITAAKAGAAPVVAADLGVAGAPRGAVAAKAASTENAGGGAGTVKTGTAPEVAADLGVAGIPRGAVAARAADAETAVGGAGTVKTGTAPEVAADLGVAGYPRGAVAVKAANLASKKPLGASASTALDEDEAAALAAYEMAKTLGKADAEALERMAELYEKDRRYTEAMDSLEAALKADPNRASAAFTLARLRFVIADDSEKGLTALKTALGAGFSDKDAAAALLAEPDLPDRQKVFDLLKTKDLVE